MSRSPGPHHHVAMLNEYGEPSGLEPPPPPPEPEAPPTACSKFLRFLRQLFGFLFSHIGLLSLVVGYSIMGAFIFEELEHANELLVKRNMTKNRMAVTERLWDITRWDYISISF